MPLGSGGNCKWGYSDEQERYCTDSDDWAGSESVDNKTSFSDYNYADDAARANWGSTWRMPTPSEIDELLNTNNCTWEWTTVNGVKGYRVTSKKSGYTNKSIFLPAGGTEGTSGVGQWGSFWSSTVDSSNSRNAYRIYIQSSSKNKSTMSRNTAAMIRPVMPK